MHPTKVLAVLASNLAICIGCGSEPQLPMPAILGAQDFGAVGSKVTFAASVSASQNSKKVGFHWRVTKDGVQIAEGFDVNFAFTPPSIGKYELTLSCRDGSRDGPVATTTLQAETKQQFDSRLTNEMAGTWRFTTEEELVLLRLHSNGKLNLRAQLLAGGMGDAMLSASQHDMGEIKGDWWVADGQLVLRASGVEHPIWNIWVRAVDAVTSGDFGKVLTCETKFLGDTMYLKGEFTEGKTRILTRAANIK